jgi:predicted nuclease of predicted toxin-antitoxin system
MVTLYLDDCADDDRLIAFLQNAGYTVISPRQVGTRATDDDIHLDYATQHGCVLITYDTDDFLDLHTDYQAQGRTHSGIFLIYRENVKSKDMPPQDIIRAIGNLLASGLSIANEVHVLNHWR